MATIQEQILERFYTKLAESKAVDEAAVDALRVLFQGGKKVKVEDLVAIFSKPTKVGRQS
jgi:hypothetical protein